MMWALTLLAGLIALPLIAELCRKPMNAKAREQAPGQFAELSQGVTHYRWVGKIDGPVVVCIHGLTTPSFVWRGISKGLSSAGFRVLTYDLYGRGFSDRPSGSQNPAFFVRQLNELLEDQQVKGRFTVIGYSMGAAIAAAFASSQPQNIARVVLLAPAGMNGIGTKTVRFMAKTPYLGKWLMLAFYPAMLRKGIDAEADLVSSVPTVAKLQKQELTYRGFLPAVHLSLRDTLTDTLETKHIRLQQAGIPVQAIWGAEDDLIPLSAKDQLHNWNHDVQNCVVENAGHGLPYTHSADVLSMIKKFLSRET